MLANLDLQLVLLFNHHDWAFGTSVVFLKYPPLKQICHVSAKLILRTERQINITWGHSSETCWFVSSCLAQTCWFVAASACMQNFWHNSAFFVFERT